MVKEKHMITLRFLWTKVYGVRNMSLYYEL